MELINLICTIVLWGIAIYFAVLAAGLVIGLFFKIGETAEAWLAKLFGALDALLTGKAFKARPPAGR